MGAQWLDFDDFLEEFGHPFFIKVRNHPNLVNCNMSPAKLVFYQITALSFGIENPLKFMFFQDAIQDPIFSHFIRFYLQKCDLWTPFKIQWASKWHPKLYKWRPKALKKHRARSLFCDLETDSLPKGRPKSHRASF